MFAMTGPVDVACGDRLLQRHAGADRRGLHLPDPATRQRLHRPDPFWPDLDPAELPRPAASARTRRRLAGVAPTASLAGRLAAIACSLLAFGVPSQAQTPCGEAPAVRAVAVVEDGRTVPPAYLNDRIAVDVCGLAALQQRATDAQQGLSLFVNGIDAGLPPVAIDRDAQRLVFVLQRTPGNEALWKPVLGNPFTERTTTLQLSVGIAGGEPLGGIDAKARAMPFKKLWVSNWTYAAGTAMLVVLGLTVYLGQRSDMLRDAPTTDPARRPTYSLARVQMAWWFVLVVGGFLAILLVTGDTDSLPASIIALTGISAATGVAAVFVTPSAEQRLAARQAALDSHGNATDTALAAVAGARASLETARQQQAAAQNAGQDTTTLQALAASLQTVLAAREHEVGQLAKQVAKQLPTSDAVPRSQGFFKDLISDKNGRVALDRLQMVVWSVLLGGLYVQSVLTYVTMPDFSATLLGLMGVSSGTYIGFKMPSRGGGG
jgi:hypothetical protein